MDNEALKKLYYDPTTGFTGAEKLWQRAKQYGLTITKKQVQDFLKEQKTEQLHAVKQKVSIPIVAPSPGYNFQIDLMDMSRYKKYNSGMAWILACVDVYSRYAWCLPMLRKEAGDVAQAITKILKQRVPRKIGTDSGTEFLNSQVQDIFRQYNIIHFTAQSGDHNKMGIVERFNKTLRYLIAKSMSANESYNWVDNLQKLVENYNNSKHSTIKVTPAQALSGMQVGKRQPVGNVAKAFSAVPIGSTVRVRDNKKTFKKGSDPSWSADTYEVVDVVGYKIKVKGKTKLYSVNNVLPISSTQEKINSQKRFETIQELIQGKKIEQNFKRDDINPQRILPATQHRTIRKPARFRD